MKRILLPTDFSLNSFNAISYALQLFKDEEIIFYLLNTYTPILYDNDYILYNATQPSLEEIYKTNSVKGLAKMIKKVKQRFPNAKHRFEQISAFNMLNDEMQKQVRDKNIDLIVMGTQGATGADEILFGTHTVHALQKAICPLLAIPSEYEYEPPKNILFPTDYEIDYREDQLSMIREVAKISNSKLHILNIITGRALDEDQERMKKVLAEKLKTVAHQFYSIEKRNVPQGISDFQNDHPVQMLAMINNKHSFFENLLFRPVINKIGFHVKVPFLVIPSGKYNP
ncbi:universal stress protein [Salegentibacter chungangensis]|uniref:Universal stress protein n=1 Tax=Salegentibacter chungangensis TaxID=1335724 RepID=A0ABW3NTV3_9FLAO